jgi:hypothetical protein
MPLIRQLRGENDSLRNKVTNLEHALGAASDKLGGENDVLRNKVTDLEYALDAASDKLAEVSETLERAQQSYESAFAGSEPLFVPPGHFYSPIPSMKDLKLNEIEIFDFPSEVRGVDLNQNGQLARLEEFIELSAQQPFTPEAIPGRRYYLDNINFSYNDAIVLFCMMRHLKPRRIIEVGSGHSSCAMLDVNELFFNDSIEFTFIEPHPELLRSLIKDSDLSQIRLLDQKVQDVDAGIFRELKASDILFIDSSHVSKTGSDLNYLLFKVLPLLNEGVVVHFHDIFYPFEYPKEWAFQGRAWNEVYLLRAFLQYNDAFEIQFFNSFLNHYYRDRIASASPLWMRGPGGSLWLKKTSHDPALDRTTGREERRSRSLPSSLEVFRWRHACFLGEGWHDAEDAHRWMATSASFQIAGPGSADAHLRIRGQNPHTDAVLSVEVEGTSIGSFQLRTIGEFDAEFSMPTLFVRRPGITVRLTVNRTNRYPGDPRDLGLAVTRIDMA